MNAQKIERLAETIQGLNHLSYYVLKPADLNKEKTLHFRESQLLDVKSIDNDKLCEDLNSAIKNVIEKYIKECETDIFNEVTANQFIQIP